MARAAMLTVHSRLQLADLSYEKIDAVLAHEVAHFWFGGLVDWA